MDEVPNSPFASFFLTQKSQKYAEKNKKVVLSCPSCLWKTTDVLLLKRQHGQLLTTISSSSFCVFLRFLREITHLFLLKEMPRNYSEIISKNFFSCFSHSFVIKKESRLLWVVTQTAAFFSRRNLRNTRKRIKKLF